MSKWVAGILIFAFLLFSVFAFFLSQKIKTIEVKKPNTSADNVALQPSSTSDTKSTLSIVAQDLEVPWALAFLPDGSTLFTERSGRVRFIAKNGTVQNQPIATITEVKQIGEGGLLGVALHPEFEKNHFVYLYYTYSSSNDNTQNRVARYTFENKTLGSRKVIVDAIPGASNHDGGRMKFGPDKYLYITTGDSQEPSLAQNKSSLAGKILRVTENGEPAPGNPFGTRIYSYGHRNPQGLAWDDSGQLWATEHGRSGIQSGFDELNLIKPGKNYGWPDIQGNEKRVGMETPALNSEGTTWAPSGAAFYHGSIFFAGLRGQGLYEATNNGLQLSLKKHLDGELGRIREVVVGPDNMLYITTSNRDGRGAPHANDDKILRVNPEKL